MDAMRTKILLINDDPARAAAARRALIDSTNGVFQVESTASCSEALERLTREGAQQKTIAAVLVDLTSPDSRGIDTIDRLLHALRIPFLVLSAPADQDTPKLAVKHRAQESPAE
jgi:DNA-binding NarL/FixJ family response regulator